MDRHTFVVAGAGLAGAKAAEELRRRGFDGRLLLIGAEAERPYERPPLTKEYLRGESERAKAYVHSPDFYEQHQIELLTGVAVTAVDARDGRVSLDDGSETRFDRLLLATGAEPRRIPVPGADLAGVHYLRTLSDCDALRERLNPGAHVVVVGAGWIGSELAASARTQGLEVTLIDPLRLPNERIFGPEVASFYSDVHRSHGVELLLGDGVASFEGDQAVRSVTTQSGRSVDCDFVVVGIGVLPRVELATMAGLEVENGVLVDEALRSSSPKVFAAGDVANARHPFYRRRLRVEHWANALNQGPAAARAMLGEPIAYDRLPYFYSDQYEIGMEYSGHALGWDEVVIRGDLAAKEFIAFWLSGGTVRAGMNVNVWDVNDKVQALIRSRHRVDAGALADVDTPLEALLPAVPAPG
jgi:3-phenylpropionate/trans-cinnamate dioxygenase ferredoxin reductase subunit